MFAFTGVDSLYKVPRFLGKIVWGAGSVSASSAPLFVLYVGMKTSAGTMVADTDVLEVTSEEAIDGYAGARSQLAWQARMGMRASKTTRHFIAAVTEATGTKATATIVIAGTWATSGSWAVTIAGTRISGSVGAADAIDTVGADMAARLTNSARLPITSAYNTSTDTLTLTCANNGVQGKDWIVAVDKSDLPAGMTLTLTGSAALAGDRARLGASSSGTGTEDVTAILTKLQTTRYARIAPAQNDATNAALWETQVNTKAGITTLLLEQLVFGTNGSQSAATTLAQTTLNAQRAQVLWMRNADIHPSVIAAVKAAIRASTEGADPVPDYDGYVLPGIPIHAVDADRPLDAESNTALNNGVTPVSSGPAGAVVIRSITSYCLDAGSAQDERTLDIGDAVMTDYATLDSKLLYDTSFRPANKYVGPDPAPGEQDPPANVAIPRNWNSTLLNRMKGWFANGWIEDPDSNPPTSQYNTTSKRIESLMPLLVRRVQHQLGNITRQTSNSV